ncbi:MAG: efflux RND transporter periplasmic adaptor subunit [Verrucomicrobia bacterium]|jgi:RND family efflux transporter MFP subunit|nr:efflux RND transporter periplasmic adaptor subunit [Verrucomicrobiota bacterium]
MTPDYSNIPSLDHSGQDKHKDEVPRGGEPTNEPTAKTVTPSSPPGPKKKTTRVIIFCLAVAGMLFLGVGALGIYQRNQWTAKVQQRTNEAARMLVDVVHPEKSTGIRKLQLPGQTMPYTYSPILAQTSGYLKKWYFDIGARVKAGDVLAEIDTPQVDYQLEQARAQLKVAQAASDLAEITYKRYQDLFKTNVISAQDFDTASENYAGEQSTVVADQAALGRLEALEAFKILRAPFDGIVTARNTDIGDYIPAGSGTELFRMAANSPLRVYVTVPQSCSSLVKAGDQAELTVSEFPGRTFPVKVVTTASAINPASKKLLTELEAPNPTGELSAGAYVQVAINIPVGGHGLMIQARTLLFESGQPAVGVVHPDGKVEIRKITIAQDFGTRLLIANGLSESDQLIINPSPGLVSGTAVTIVNPATTTSIPME